MNQSEARNVRERKLVNMGENKIKFWSKPWTNRDLNNEEEKADDGLRGQEGPVSHILT